MKELTVISGKGGTGKTTVVGAFAALAKNAVLADCDVDAADLHLLLKPTVKQTHDFSGGKLASVITEKCIGCGKCEQVCSFDAPKLIGPPNNVIDKTFIIDPIACEGCSVCLYFCPADAIEFKDQINGQYFISDTRFGPMVHARLGIAEENSGKLVSLIRKQAKQIATEQNKDLIIIDGSPGIGCPVIASITAADLVLIVTEPTLSARHDLERVVRLTKHFNIPAALCINKYDINPEMADHIEKSAAQQNLHILGKIPYDNIVTRAQVAGKTVVEHSNGILKQQIVALFQATLNLLKTEN